MRPFRAIWRPSFLNAWRKPAERRYTSAQALSDDLSRFLEDRPITARPVSRSEHLWRWCRRNPVVASLATGVIVALSVGIAASSYFAAASAREARAAKINLTSARGTLVNMLDILQTVHDLIDRTPEAVSLRKPLRDDILRHLAPLSQEIEQRDLEAGEETIRLLDAVAYLQIEAKQFNNGLRTSLHTLELAQRLAQTDPTKEPLVSAMQGELSRYLMVAAYEGQEDVDLEAARLAMVKALGDAERRAEAVGEPPLVGGTYRSLALCAARRDDYAEAQRLRLAGIDREEAIVRRDARSGRRTICWLLIDYGRDILKEEKLPARIAEADPYFERAIEQARRWGQIELIDRSEKMDAQRVAAMAELCLGMCRYRVGRAEEGTRLVQRAVDELRNSPNPGAISVAGGRGRAHQTAARLGADRRSQNGGS